MDNLEQRINLAWEHSNPILEDILLIYELLDKGEIRVAQKIDNNWIINQWIKKAILLSFKVFKNQIIDKTHYDKIPLKFPDLNQGPATILDYRIVPGAVIRKSAFIAKTCILMPSFINIAAYVDEGTLVDTWATIGSCAQIGKNCHISGGVGIGGVLEPLQANPVIIEDNCFIGARSEIAEGVIIGEGSVISMGVFLGQSTKIFNSLTKDISYGYIPPYSVVIPGSLPREDGSYSTSAAIIIKQVDQKTRSKTSINDLLR